MGGTKRRNLTYVWIAIAAAAVVPAAAATARSWVAADAPPAATVLVGGGVDGLIEGAPAARRAMDRSKGVAVGPDGSIWFTLVDRHSVYRIGEDGLVGLVAGTGQSGSSGDGGPAIAATLHSPLGIDVDQAGNAYVADGGNDRVRRIASDGTITTVAVVRSPTAVAASPDGTLYVGTAATRLVHRLSGGSVTVFAGNGLVPPQAPLDGRAVDRPIGEVSDVKVDRRGDVVIAAKGFVWRADQAGHLRRLAGLGTTGAGGTADGLAGALTATDPASVAVMPDGTVVYADATLGAVRRISAEGAVATIVVRSSPSALAFDGSRLVVASGKPGAQRLEAIAAAS